MFKEPFDSLCHCDQHFRMDTLLRKPSNRRETGNSFAHRWSINSDQRSVLNSLQIRIVESCKQLPLCSKVIYALLNLITQHDVKHHLDSLNTITVFRFLPYNHCMIDNSQPIADNRLDTVGILTWLLDRNQRDCIRMLIEYGIDVQEGTNWLVCQDKIDEYYHEYQEYDPVVMMLEDCADYLPHYESYIKEDRKLTTYASYVEDWSCLKPILKRHGSLYHLWAWSDCAQYTIDSWQLEDALHNDLIALSFREALLESTLISLDYCIGWLDGPLLKYGVDDNPWIPGTRANTIKQRLFCPMFIMFAFRYQHTDTAKHMLNTFHNHVIPSSQSIRLKACSSLLISRLVDVILYQSEDSSLELTKFLVRDYHANPNILFYDLFATINLIQSVYEELTQCHTQFVNDTERMSFMESIRQRLYSISDDEEQGSSILHRLSGQYMGKTFALLIEEGGGNPWIKEGTFTLQHTPFYYACCKPWKSILSYYFEKLIILSINECCLDDNTKTPLMYACEIGATDAIEYFVTKLQAKANVRNRYGETAIIYAAHYNHYHAVLKLFKLYGKDRIDCDVYDRFGVCLKDIILENDLLRLQLKEYFPITWYLEKMDNDNNRLQSKKKLRK